MPDLSHVYGGAPLLLAVLLFSEPVLQNFRTMSISVKQVPETSYFGQIMSQAWSDFCRSSIYIKCSICIITVFDDFTLLKVFIPDIKRAEASNTRANKWCMLDDMS